MSGELESGPTLEVTSHARTVLVRGPFFRVACAAVLSKPPRNLPSHGRRRASRRPPVRAAQRGAVCIDPARGTRVGLERAPSAAIGEFAGTLGLHLNRRDLASLT